MNVTKFGGSSVKDAKAFLRCLEIVKGSDTAVVILSATYNTTNDLEKFYASKEENLAKSIIERHILIASDLGVYDEKTAAFLSDRFQDLMRFARNSDILAIGERISSFLFYRLLKKHLKREVVLLDAGQLIKIGETVDFDETLALCHHNCLPSVKQGKLVITQGFIASNKEGQTVTLGREGSDYSATIIASVLNVDEVHIWTDVDGIYNVDPRYVVGAQKVDKMSYQQATDLASHGAKVLFPETLAPLYGTGILVKVRSSLDPSLNGTIITEDCRETTNSMAIKKISDDEDCITVFYEGQKLTFTVKTQDREKELRSLFLKYLQKS